MKGIQTCRDNSVSCCARRIINSGLLLIFLFLVSCTQLPKADFDAFRSQDSDNAPQHLALLRDEGEKIAGTSFLPGNRVTLLRDGAAAYPAMLAAIKQARHRIYVESFTFDENAGADFAKALLERRHRGVDVYLIYDAYGSDDTPSEVFDQMRDGGIKIIEYNPIDPFSAFDSSFNHRDHRKLLIVDDAVAFTGGINISAVYKVRHLKHLHDQDDLDPEKTPWRDTQVRIEGPAVDGFEKLFVTTWREQGEEPLTYKNIVHPSIHGDLWVQPIDGTPDHDHYAIYQSLIMAITLAKKSVYLTTAYFVPTPDVLRVLQDAARRGVDVTLLLPSHSDSDLSLKAGHSYYDGLLEAGVHIYERQNVILHAKTAVIDGVWSMVGSSNLDWRSVLFNNECNAVILGDKFGQQMEAMFRDDLTQATPITLETWRDRPAINVIDEWKAQLFEYLL